MGRKSKKSKIKIDLQGFQALQDNIDELKKYRVRVGILGSKATEVHSESDKTNVFIGMIHEFGSIDGRIPERSFLRMPVQKKLKDIKEELKKNKDKIIELVKNQEFETIFSNIGIIIERIIQEAFESSGFGEWKENAYITIHGGWMRSKTGKPIHIKGKGSDKPLIDTGQLRRSITSKVIKKNG